jgi:hypothetical protein
MRGQGANPQPRSLAASPAGAVIPFPSAPGVPGTDLSENMVFAVWVPYPAFDGFSASENHKTASQVIDLGKIGRIIE